MSTYPFVLASSSAHRLTLLDQMGICPDHIESPDVDERPLKGEKPSELCVRLAQNKAQKIFQNHRGSYVLAADTVVCVGRRCLGKPENQQQAHDYLSLLSGRSHRVYGAIELVCPDGRAVRRCVLTRVRFKRLSDDEIKTYVENCEWQGKAGGYAIQGLAGVFVKDVSGSFFNVVGLCISTLYHLLRGVGYDGPLS